MPPRPTRLFLEALATAQGAKEDAQRHLQHGAQKEPEVPWGEIKIVRLQMSQQPTYLQKGFWVPFSFSFLYCRTLTVCPASISGYTSLFWGRS